MDKKRPSFVSLRLGTLVVAASANAATAQVTARVNLSSAGEPANSFSFGTGISSDGRHVVFTSHASNLVAGDTNQTYDVFVRDRQMGTLERASVSSGGVEANSLSGSEGRAISADGRYVAFESGGSNLVPNDANDTWDVFVRDRQGGTTELVSVSLAGVPGNSTSGQFGMSMSPDGRFVAFTSFATNLVAGDTNGQRDVFVRDRQNGTTQRASLSSTGAEPNGESRDVSISPGGRYVAFWSSATNLVAGDGNGVFDVFVRDLQSGTTERASLDSAGNAGNGASSHPAISSDGRFVAFLSEASNLVPGDTNNEDDVFVRDRQNGTTERVSCSTTGTQGNFESFEPSISPDGRFVIFASHATNLVAGDTNGQADVFVRDRQSGTTERVNVTWAGAQANSFSSSASLSPDGRFVAFTSPASNMVPADTNGQGDVFVRDRLGAPDFTSLCHPGLAGVMSCPCSNPPSAAGRGCNNSSNTGGAILSASGGTYLSSDSLVFTTSGEKPTALSIVAQWNGVNSAGVVFGQGVRCTSGLLKRLFAKSAVAGSITAPDFAAGDETVSRTSAVKGDILSAAQSRWYVVYYRDNTILGGCPPPSSNFNATQTGRATWAP